MKHEQRAAETAGCQRVLLSDEGEEKKRGLKAEF